MPVFEDWLKEPLRIINNIYASDSLNFDVKVNEYFENKLKSEKNYYSIPCLNDVSIHELTPNCLIRYRCMIQDSSNPEYFVSHHKLKHQINNDLINLPSKYKDVVNYPDGYESYNETNHIEDQTNNAENLCQRLTFYCVPIPGESEWVKTIHKLNSFSSTVCSIASTSSQQNRPIKRAIDAPDEYENEISNGIEKLPLTTLNQIDENSTIKRSKSNAVNGDNKTLNQTNLINLNFPLQNQENGVTCLVKVYENFESFKINDLVEFIGILSIDPTLAYCNHCLNQQKLDNNENKMETDSELNNYMLNSYRETLNTCSCSYAPPSLVPRLHAIQSFHLKYINPLLGNIYNDYKFLSKDNEQEGKFWNGQMINLLNNLASKNSNNLNLNSLQSTLDSSNLYLLIKLRQEIINYFQEYLLLGDSLSAEYLLMNLVSGIFARKDVTILGKFTLNIHNIPVTQQNPLLPLPLVASNNETTNKTEIADNKITFSMIFYKYFKEILTMSHLFKLSVDSLNNSNFIPNKDYNNDKLNSGMLQLPDRFELVIDETNLNAGELKQKGLLNLHALNDVIKWQKLNYDFGFHSHEFLTNIRILIISHTKSLLAHDCQFKLQPAINNNNFKVEDYEANLQRFHSNELNANFLNNFRKYLTIVSQLDYKLTDDMQKIVEEDFVQMRQGNTNEKICVEDFHLLLVVARLQCLTYGKSELTLNEWNKAKLIEKERKARLV